MSHDNSVSISLITQGVGHALYGATEPFPEPQVFANYAGYTGPARRVLARENLGVEKVLLDPVWDCYTGIFIVGARPQIEACFSHIETMMAKVLDTPFDPDDMDSIGVAQRAVLFGSEGSDGSWCILVEGYMEDGFDRAFLRSINSYKPIGWIEFGSRINDYTPLEAMLEKIGGTYEGSIHGWRSTPAIPIVRTMLQYEQQRPQAQHYADIIQDSPKLQRLFGSF